MNGYEGMEQSSANAERKIPGWNKKALEYVRFFPEKKFQAEDVRRYAEKQGFPVPPSKRAWGSVMVKARKLGYIRSCGMQRKTSDNSHGTPAVVWEKL